MSNLIPESTTVAQSTNITDMYLNGGVNALVPVKTVIVDRKHIELYGNNLFDILRSLEIPESNMMATMILNGMRNPSDIHRVIGDKVSVTLDIPRQA